MKTLCCDKATMKKITEDTQDYTNTTSGMNEIASSNFKVRFPWWSESYQVIC